MFDIIMSKGVTYSINIILLLRMSAYAYTYGLVKTSLKRQTFERQTSDSCIFLLSLAMHVIQIFYS